MTIIKSFTPGNIFLARDFYRIFHPQHGEITIGIDGAYGWRAYTAESRLTLTEFNDVWNMCAWLIRNDCEARKITS